jgi:hypothetical protein
MLSLILLTLAGEVWWGGGDRLLRLPTLGDHGGD